MRVLCVLCNEGLQGILIKQEQDLFYGAMIMRLHGNSIGAFRKKCFQVWAA